MGIMENFLPFTDDVMVVLVVLQVKNQLSDQSRVDNSQSGKVRKTILTHNM